MREQDRVAAVERGVGDNRAQWEGDPGFVAGMAAEVQAARLIIEVRHPQAFAGGVAVRNAHGKEGARGSDAVEFQRKFGTLTSHCARVIEPAAAGDRNHVHDG